MIRTAPIQFTPVLDGWQRLLTAMGMVVVVDEPGWVVVGAGAGVVALHHAEEARLELWFESDTPEAAARSTGGEASLKEADDVGELWRATMPDGQVLGFSSWVAAENERSGALAELAVQPLWMTPDVAGAAAALEKAGARPRIASDSGGWVDFVLDDGQAAVHHGARAATVLGFEFDGDLAVLAERVTVAGLEARLIDESYGRSLRVDHPDGEEEIWINQTQTDLYGYRLGLVSPR